jgi:hypothetical protein
LAELEKKQSFWTTMPGVLTGIAAVLTAVTGLLVVMYPHGFAGSKEGSPAAAISSNDPAGAAPNAAGSSAPASATPSATPKQQKPTVLVVGKDGTQTGVSLRGFQDSQSGEAIGLKNGQTIPFDKIRSVDFVETHGYDEDVKVTLTDGRTVEGDIMAGEQLTGETDIGPFSISVKDVKQIVFER